MSKTGGGSGTNQYRVRGNAGLIRKVPHVIQKMYTMDDINRWGVEGRIEIGVDETYTPPKVLEQLAVDQNCQVRQSVASNMRTPSETLCALAHDLDAEVVKHVAINDSTPLEALWTIHRREELPYAIFIAGHPNSSSELLGEIAEHCGLEWRNRQTAERVANNSHTPAMSLDTLATHMAVPVRAAVARNPRTAVKTLKYLVGDTTPYVRSRVLSNSHCPTSVLVSQARTGSGRVVTGQPAVAIAGNPHTPATTLALLLGSKDAQVRQAVLNNPSTPPHFKAIGALGR